MGCNPAMNYGLNSARRKRISPRAAPAGLQLLMPSTAWHRVPPRPFTGKISSRYRCPIPSAPPSAISSWTTRRHPDNPRRRRGPNGGMHSDPALCPSVGTVNIPVVNEPVFVWMTPGGRFPTSSCFISENAAGMGNLNAGRVTPHSRWTFSRIIFAGAEGFCFSQG